MRCCCCCCCLLLLLLLAAAAACCSCCLLLLAAAAHKNRDSFPSFLGRSARLRVACLLACCARAVCVSRVCARDDAKGVRFPFHPLVFLHADFFHVCGVQLSRFFWCSVSLNSLQFFLERPLKTRGVGVVLNDARIITAAAQNLRTPLTNTVGPLSPEPHGKRIKA